MSGGPQAQMQGPLAHIWLDLMRPVCLYVSHILRIPLNFLQIVYFTDVVRRSVSF